MFRRKGMNKQCLRYIGLAAVAVAGVASIIKPADIILLLVTLVADRVDDADRWRSRIEIESR